jgi:hypothetical protein
LKFAKTNFNNFLGGVNMRKKAFFWGLIFAICNTALGQPISDVSVFPESPNISDFVIAQVSGDQWQTNNIIEQTIFSQNGNILTLDMYWTKEGYGFPVVLPYTYQEEIGMFSPGEYVLNVNSFFWGNTDFGSTSFTVVPEPGTLLLLSFGSLALLRKRRS